MELSGSNIKKFLYFLKEKLFLYFGKPKTPKKFLIFQETEPSYISGNGNPKKPLMFPEVTFRARKIKRTLLTLFWMGEGKNYPPLGNNCFNEKFKFYVNQI